MTKKKTPSPAVTAGLPAVTWLSIQDVADYLHVDYRIVYNAARAGQLRGLRVGTRGVWRFQLAWVQAWLESLVYIPGSGGPNDAPADDDGDGDGEDGDDGDEAGQ
jgi:excisionase family DNA binding protein